MDTQHKAQVVTEEEYNEMFEILPPLYIFQDGNFHSFLMSEFYSGRLTHQYASMGNRYLKKLVDVDDPSTWIGHKDFQHLEDAQ